MYYFKEENRKKMLHTQQHNTRTRFGKEKRPKEAYLEYGRVRVTFFIIQNRETDTHALQQSNAAIPARARGWANIP